MIKKELKVLICDDSILVRKKLKDALEQAECKNILEASDGQVAVNMCKKYRPDLVFLDIVMPNKDGIQALTEIKEFDQSINVVMASSAGTQTYLKQAIKLGVYDFLQKPLTSDAVSELMNRFIKARG